MTSLLPPPPLPPARLRPHFVCLPPSLLLQEEGEDSPTHSLASGRRPPRRHFLPFKNPERFPLPVCSGSPGSPCSTQTKKITLQVSWRRLRRCRLNTCISSQILQPYPQKINQKFGMTLSTVVAVAGNELKSFRISRGSWKGRVGSNGQRRERLKRRRMLSPALLCLERLFFPIRVVEEEGASSGRGEAG